MVEDTTKNLAVAGAATHEDDVTLMFLERAQSSVPQGRTALVVFDRPGGDRKAEDAFLGAPLSKLRAGTTYSTLDRLALAVSTDSGLSRLVQLADVVVACSTAFVAGEHRFSPKIFREGVLPLLRSELGRVGGIGLKIHPDLRYANLYHWLLGDGTWWKRSMGVPLPCNTATCYVTSADEA